MGRSCGELDEIKKNTHPKHMFAFSFGEQVFETKVDALLKHLTRITGEDSSSKVLVFSQFASTLKRIQEVLPTVCVIWNAPPVWLNGAVSSKRSNGENYSFEDEEEVLFRNQKY